MQVAALEVQNVKRAINRYGTLPKGARIGAFLESLRQGSLSPGPKCQEDIVASEEDSINQISSPHPSLRNTSHMIRSNSSGGVTAPSIPIPASPPARVRRPMTGIRNYYPNESLRSGSPSKANPSLADLEFPPPPTDLPPPPDDLSCPILTTFQPQDDLSVFKKKSRQQKEISSESFKSTSSTKSKSFVCSSNLDSKNVFKVSNPISIDGDFSKPISNADNDEELNKYDSNFKSNMKEMLELKLVDEIKERADKKGLKIPKESPPNNGVDVHAAIGDPVARLVSELSESLNIKAIDPGEKSELSNTSKLGDAKSSLRKTAIGTSVSSNENKKNSTFKLSKADSTPKSNVNNRKIETNTSTTIIDFKSRLRKVETSNGTTKKIDNNSPLEENQAKEIDSKDNTNDSVEKKNDNIDTSKVEDEDDKRRSTGSISSLKKLWEPKESMMDVTTSQLSPKLSLKNNKQSVIEEKNDENVKNIQSDKDNTYNEDSSVSNIMTRSLNANNKAGERRVWPMGIDEKPIVPVKPIVKPVKPGMGGKGPGAIYATPITPVVTSTKPVAKLQTDEPKGARENIIEISQALETSIGNLKGNNSISSSSWLQLSDKVDMFYAACIGYSADIAPPHQRFQFREVTAKLESQTRALRSAGAKSGRSATDPGSEAPRLLADVAATVRDAISALNR